jgi:hypothetical protein
MLEGYALGILSVVLMYVAFLWACKKSLDSNWPS